MKKILTWIVCFVCSVILANAFGWDQGMVFIGFHLAALAILAIIFIAASIYSGSLSDLLLVVLSVLAVVVVAFCITFFVSKVFDISFLVAYQIIALGQAFSLSDKKQSK